MTPLAEAEQRDRLRLARTEGVGPITFRRLLRRFGSAARALEALPELARAGGRTAALAVRSAALAERELAALAAMGGRMIFLGGPDYPPLLALLEDAPPAIAVLGDPAALGARAVALVGARNASANGQRMAEALAAELAAAGLVIVSGLARGVDTAAHRGALAAGRTVAAVAGGLDRPYPPENAVLQRRIAAQGAVVAEAPLGTAPQARHFPRRNRLIAGLSLGVVVVEAALRSGSLITARLAAEAGREVFAVPGSPLDLRARGSNHLLRQGATLTEGAADVLAGLPDHPKREGLARLPLFARPAPGDGGWAEEAEAEAPETGADPGADPGADLPPGGRAALLALLGPEPVAVDDLVRRCQFSPAAAMAALLELELAGRVESLPGNRVALVADTRTAERAGLAPTG